MSQYPEINRYDDHSNKLKNENQTIISEDAGNSDKFQQWFMIKPLNKLGIEKTYLNIIKVETKPQPTSYQKWKAESISSEIGNKTSTTTLATFIQHSIGSPSHRNKTENKTRKRNKRNPSCKRSKLSLFADHVILYGVSQVVCDTLYRKY